MNASVEAIEGSHVSLLCGADSNPLPLLTWMRDGTVLREAVAESLFLDLEEVTPAEDGVYACLAENAYGQENRTVGLSVMCESPARPSTGPGAERLGETGLTHGLTQGPAPSRPYTRWRWRWRGGRQVEAFPPASQSIWRTPTVTTLIPGTRWGTDAAPPPGEAC